MRKRRQRELSLEHLEGTTEGREGEGREGEGREGEGRELLLEPLEGRREERVLLEPHEPLEGQGEEREKGLSLPLKPLLLCWRCWHCCCCTEAAVFVLPPLLSCFAAGAAAAVVMLLYLCRLRCRASLLALLLLCLCCCICAAAAVVVLTLRMLSLLLQQSLLCWHCLPVVVVLTLALLLLGLRCWRCYCFADAAWPCRPTVMCASLPSFSSPLHAPPRHDVMVQLVMVSKLRVKEAAKACDRAQHCSQLLLPSELLRQELA